MENYSITIQRILAHKESQGSPHAFELEPSRYHWYRIQPTDVSIIIENLNETGVKRFEFAAELYCRTLLAQLVHFKYKCYFGNLDYEVPKDMQRFHFVETVGWCPGRCRRHIHPLVLPLLILYWKPEAKYAFHGSDNPSDEEAQRTLSLHFQSFVRYKSSFVERVPALFDYLLKASTPSSVKSKIVDDFVNFPVALNDQVSDLRSSRGRRMGFPHESQNLD